MKQFLLAILGTVLALSPAGAHVEPTSFVDLRPGPSGLAVSITASTTDVAHDLPSVEPAMLLDATTLAAQRSVLAETISARLHIVADGQSLDAELIDIVPISEKRDLRFELHYAWPAAPDRIRVQARLFPYDPRHRTFLNIYQGEALLRQETLEGEDTLLEFQVGAEQSIAVVVREFVFEGIHHIFIGPDHILFVVGLMLLGGSVGRILKIITAFTIAHSITLGLATFRVLNPPAAVIEPIIALSIVFVGVHAFLGKTGRDPRLLFAFCFGLIHGFGFANVLQQMMLPRHALGWSLFAFNGGVELGQGCIVAVVAPLLAFVRRASPPVAQRVVATGALGVTAAGAFWFFQRIMQ